MCRYSVLLSGAWKASASTFDLEQEAKKSPFKFHSLPHSPRPPQTPASDDTSTIDVQEFTMFRFLLNPRQRSTVTLTRVFGEMQSHPELIRPYLASFC
jgi:hypothetical protein